MILVIYQDINLSDSGRDLEKGLNTELDLWSRGYRIFYFLTTKMTTNTNFSAPLEEFYIELTKWVCN